MASIFGGMGLARLTQSCRALGIKDRFIVGYVGTHGMAHGLMNVLDTAALLRERTDMRSCWLELGGT